MSITGNSTSQRDAPKFLTATRAGKNGTPTQWAGYEVAQHANPIIVPANPASASDSSDIGAVEKGPGHHACPGNHFPLATATLYSEIVPPQSRPPLTGVFVIVRG